MGYPPWCGCAGRGRARDHGAGRGRARDRRAAAANRSFNTALARTPLQTQHRKTSSPMKHQRPSEILPRRGCAGRGRARDRRAAAANRSLNNSTRSHPSSNTASQSIESNETSTTTQRNFTSAWLCWARPCSAPPCCSRKQPIRHSSGGERPSFTKHHIACSRKSTLR